MRVGFGGFDHKPIGFGIKPLTPQTLTGAASGPPRSFTDCSVQQIGLAVLSEDPDWKLPDLQFRVYGVWG